MLALTRHLGEALLILPTEEFDQHMTLAELFRNEAPALALQEIRGNQAFVGIEALKNIPLLRGECLERRK